MSATPTTSDLARTETAVLREIRDVGGAAAFDRASRRLLFHVAALIGHVSGPQRLRDLLDACEIANKPPRTRKPRTASPRRFRVIVGGRT